MNLSLKTVSNHRRNIFRKLRIHDAVLLTHHAVNAGWIAVEETPETYPDFPEESGQRSVPRAPSQSAVTALRSAR